MAHNNKSGVATFEALDSNDGQKNTLSCGEGNLVKTTTDLGSNSPRSSVNVTFSKINKHGQILTKKVSRGETGIISDASECRMSSGAATRVTIPFHDLPEYLSKLEANEAIATGWVNDLEIEHEILPKEKYLDKGMAFPAHSTDLTHYSTRTKESFIQKGPSLVMFDYDYDENAPIHLNSPTEFIEALTKVLPEFDQISYVRTYSTSSAVYDIETNECLRPAEGFHIYMVIADGSDLEAFGARLNKRLWLMGLGHIKLSKSLAMLKRTLVDVAVFSPERLIFEAGAVLADGLEQRLPKPEFVSKQMDMLDTKKLKALTPTEEQQLLHKERLAKTSDKLILEINALKKDLILDLVHTKRAHGVVLTARQAEKIVDAKANYQLTYDDVVVFESGAEVTVAELLFNPEPYDKQPCLDPLREDKGFGRVLFYANTETNNPIIHSFVEGGRIYRLHEAITIVDDTQPEIIEENFRKISNEITVQNNRYVDIPYVLPGITIVKAGKGEGKTEAISKWLSNHRGLRTLNVTHRVTLARSLGTRFQMDIYNDESMTPEKLITTQHLSCCYDSVYKLANQHYEVVILDEIVQLMRHMVSETVSEKFLAMQVLLNIVYNAKYVVMMDADIQPFHIEFLKEILLIRPTTNINVILNVRKSAQGRTLNVLETIDGRPDELTLLKRMVEASNKGGMFYASNSVKDVELKAEQVLREMGYDVNVNHGEFIVEFDNRRAIIISGNNSGNIEVQAFIDNINNLIREDDLVFCSPSMGTGVSIDSRGGKPRFNEIFGRFTKRAGNTPSDCSQHLSRVRDCNHYTIAVVDDTSFECTDAAMIVDQKLLTAVKAVDAKTNPFHHCWNFDAMSGQYIWLDSGYSLWLGFIKGMEAQERNMFGDHLKIQFDQEGYTIETRVLSLEESMGAERANLDGRVKGQKAEAKEREYQIRRLVPLITDEEYQTLKNKRNLKIDERRKVEKRYYSDIMGITDMDDLNHLLCDSDANIANRVSSLVLGMDPAALLVREISNRVDSKKQHIDKTAEYERYHLAKRAAELVGVTMVEGSLVSDDRPLDEDAMDSLHHYLYSKASQVKKFFGVGVVKGKDIQKRNQSLLSFLKKLGIRTHRVSARNSQNQPAKVRFIDADSLYYVNTDIKQALKGSVLAGFNPPKPTGDLATFVLYQETHLGHLMPDIQRYLYALNDRTLKELDAALNFKGTNALYQDCES
jgi:hypothetical protein